MAGTGLVQPVEPARGARPTPKCASTIEPAQLRDEPLFTAVQADRVPGVVADRVFRNEFGPPPTCPGIPGTSSRTGTQGLGLSGDERAEIPAPRGLGRPGAARG